MTRNLGIKDVTFDYLDKIFLSEHPRGQFHQHFTRTFFDDVLAPKNYKAKM